MIKQVINDNGGTAAASEFTMTVTATTPSPSSFAGEEAGTLVSLDAGAYSVNESGPSGYSAIFSSECGGFIADGETKTCTVTNDDIGPDLIVIKNVVNDDGGTAVASDFTMTVDATNPSQSSFAGQESPGATVSLNAGSYSVDESGPSGYAASFSADCSGSVALAETKTCTVTNDDVPPTPTETPSPTPTAGVIETPLATVTPIAAPETLTPQPTVTPSPPVAAPVTPAAPPASGGGWPASTNPPAAVASLVGAALLMLAGVHLTLLSARRRND